VPVAPQWMDFSAALTILLADFLAGAWIGMSVPVLDSSRTGELKLPDARVLEPVGQDFERPEGPCDSKRAKTNARR
jgi:hypothetical protein